MIKIIQKEQNICEIRWNDVSHDEWYDLFHSIKRANLLQSSEYVLAMAKLNNQRVKFGIIYINDRKAGLISVLEAGIFKNLVHGVIIDRAPLWFENYGSSEDFELFLSALSSEFPKRFARKIRFIPEMDKIDVNVKLLEKYGFKCLSYTSYQTIWLDLRHDLEVLRKNLNAKWRNQLNKAEKSGLDIVFSDKGENYSWLMQHYTIDKSLRNYDGASIKTINALASKFLRGKNMLIGSALLEGEVIAGILIFIHGSSATYQIGYSSDLGRKKCAHNLLLWRAVCALKERNINDFDLGGINDESAKSVKVFKSGLGGKIYESLGVYC